MRVLIISADLFEDSELQRPFHTLQSSGYDVDVASLKSGWITGKHGLKVAITLTVDRVKPENYALLILPGGKAPSVLRKNTDVIKIVRNFFEHSKPIAAICHGPQILISAGLVKSKKMTSYKSVASELKEAGAVFIDAPVVVDDQLITSRQPSDLDNFIREILKKLNQSESVSINL